LALRQSCADWRTRARKEGSPMLKVDILVVRKDGTTHDEFLAYWRDRHATFFASQPIVQKTVRRYLQSRTIADPPAGAPVAEFDGVAQLWFDDVAGCNDYLRSENYRDVIRLDELKFTNPDKTTMLFSKETTIFA
jgi:uncharacterized protein (TIGR02118 family)